MGKRVVPVSLLLVVSAPVGCAVGVGEDPPFAVQTVAPPADDDDDGGDDDGSSSGDPEDDDVSDDTEMTTTTGGEDDPTKGTFDPVDDDDSGETSGGETGGGTPDEQPPTGWWSQCNSTADCTGGLVCAHAEGVAFGVCVDTCAVPGDPAGCGPSPGGTATPMCVAAASDNLCALDCSGGATCPTPMSCVTVSAALHVCI